MSLDYKIRTEDPIIVKYNNNGFEIKENNFQIKEITYIGLELDNEKTPESTLRKSVQKRIQNIIVIISKINKVIFCIYDFLTNIFIIGLLFWLCFIPIIIIFFLIKMLFAYVMIPIMKQFEKRIDIIYNAILFLYMVLFISGIILNIPIINLSAGFLSLIYGILTLKQWQRYFGKDFEFFTGEKIDNSKYVFIYSFMFMMVFTGIFTLTMRKFSLNLSDEIISTILQLISAFSIVMLIYSSNK